MPSEEIIEQVTGVPSEKIRPPRIEECKLHLECKLKWRKDNIFVGSKDADRIGEITELPLTICRGQK